MLPAESIEPVATERRRRGKLKRNAQRRNAKNAELNRNKKLNVGLSCLLMMLRVSKNGA